MSLNKLFDTFEELKNEAYLSGKKEASLWYKNANLEQIKSILSDTLLEYAINNDINFIYEGAKNDIDWIYDLFEITRDPIFNEDSGNPYDICFYVVWDLMVKYHDGFKDGVREKCGRLADAIVSCDDKDKENKIMMTVINT